MDIKERLEKISFASPHEDYSLDFLDELTKEPRLFNYYNIDNWLVIETKFSMN